MTTELSYESALELKKSGFPQPTLDFKGEYIFPHKNAPLNTQVYDPTLEELIEECGKELKGLHQLFGQPAKWMAQGWVRAFFGPTPKEAVARLWLALNKKTAA